MRTWVVTLGGYFSESGITVQVEEAAALRCGCGHGILCEVKRAGEHLGFLAFFDDEPMSETWGERVESCPDCREQLGFPMLFPKNRTAQAPVLSFHHRFIVWLFSSFLVS